MKKNLKFLLAALMVFPFVANADMAAPAYRDTEVIITSEKGVECKTYKETKTYKKGDVVKVYYLEDKGDKTKYYLEGECPISTDDFKLRTEEVSPNEKDILKKKVASEAVIINKDGLDIRKGPGRLYDTVGHLDNGTTIQYQYVYVDEEGYVLNAYVETDSGKGWIDIIADRFDKANIKEVYKGDMKLIVSKDVTVDGVKIPANTILDIKYNAAPQYENALYSVAEYNGKELNLSEVNNVYFVNESNPFGTIKFTQDVAIYKNAGNKGTKLSTIPKETKANLIGSINYNVDFEEGNSADVFVEYNGVKGWIVVSSKNLADDGITYYERDEDIYEKREEPQSDDKKEEKKDDNKEEKKTGFSKNQLIWFAIGGGIGAACGAVILLIKNNKKADKK